MIGRARWDGGGRARTREAGVERWMRWRENSGVARGGRCARWTRGCDAETREDDLGPGHGRARLMTHPLFSFARRLLMPTTTARGAASAVSIRSSRNTCACSFALVERSRSRRERREDDAISSESRYRRVDKVDKGGGRAGAGRAREACGRGARWDAEARSRGMW